MYEQDELPRFSGFCAGLSLEDRTLVNDHGGSFYPIRVRLHECRKRAGISKESMALRLGFHRTTILRYETGAIRTIDNDKLKTWAELCGVPMKWIQDGGPSGDKKLDLRANKAGCRMMGYPEPVELLG